MTPKKTRIIALILVGVLIFGLAATGLSALLLYEGSKSLDEIPLLLLLKYAKMTVEKPPDLGGDKERVP